MANLPEVTTADLLSFQDSDTANVFNSENTDDFIRTDKSDTAKIDIDDDNSNTNAEGTGTTEKSFWSIEYYQQFFDVDTKDVLTRIAFSFIPKFSNSASRFSSKFKPDLYGPLWISITLIITIAIGGNISNYLHYANSSFHWHYNFHVVSYAATTVSLYVTIIPFILWLALRSNGGNDIDGATVTPGFLELLCLYGYSLFIFIPVSVFWLIQVKIIQWSMVLVAALLSVSVLILRLIPALRVSKYKLFCLLSILILHFSLAAGFMLCFFHIPESVIIIPTNSTNSSTAPLNLTLKAEAVNHTSLKSADIKHVISPIKVL